MPDTDPTPQEETDVVETPVVEPETTGVTEDQSEPEDLGDAGKKALAAERQARRAAEKAAKAAQAELEKAREATLSETERLVAQAKREAREELQAEYAKKVVRAEVKAAATGKLSDPDDALIFIDVNEFDVDEDGQVDSKEISKAVEQLLKSKPYLSAAQRVGGDVDGGARGKASTTSGDMNALIRRAAGL
jgi:membrane protein involved in colicin uptake